MRRPCGPIETEPGLIAFEKLDPSGKFRIGVLALDTNPEPVRGAEGTITSEGVDLEVVLGVHGVGGNAGVHLAVTQNRNVESVMGVGPHVEIRGVVPSQIDRISQYAVALDGADQQVRRIVGCIVAVLLPLIGNRRNGALHIRERIEHAFGTHSGGGSFAAVHVIGSHGRRGILRAEEPHDTRNGHQTQRAHLDVGICDRDTTSDFRRNAPHLDVGKPQRTAHVGRDRDLLLADHRQHVAVVAMGECEVVRIGFGFEVTAQIGRDTQPIGSRPACKGERRGCLGIHVRRSFRSGRRAKDSRREPPPHPLHVSQRPCSRDAHGVRPAPQGPSQDRCRFDRGRRHLPAAARPTEKTAVS